MPQNKSFLTTLFNGAGIQPSRLKNDAGYAFHDLNHFIRQAISPADVVNQKEIRIVGLRRSGNHAIINWIRKQETGFVRHLNNIPALKNPYRALYAHYPKEELRVEAIGHFKKKDCLIYSYEDYEFNQIVAPSFEKKREFYLGKSARRFDAVILRDPYNMIASRLKGTRARKDYMAVKGSEPNLTQLWIAYAKEYLGETHFFKDEAKVLVNYNQWVADVEYRRTLAKQLDLTFTDAGYDQVKGYGGGSSFDGQNLDGDATRMNVLARWQNFLDDEEYLSLVQNEELHWYSQKIFGPIPGVELLTGKSSM